MWEATVRHKITYFKPYPDYFLPFDQGCIKNFRMTFFHENKLVEWTLPNPKDIDPIGRNGLN